MPPFDSSLPAGVSGPRPQRCRFVALLVSLAGLALVFAGAGCTAPAPVAPVAATPAPAHLTVINQTGYDWRIAVSGPGGGTVYLTRLAAHGTVTADLAGGDCVIEQTVLTEGAAPDLNRKIPTRLEAGKAYRWRLVTLLSGPDGDAGPR